MIVGTLGAGKEWRSVFGKRCWSCLRNSVFLFIPPFANFLYCRVSFFWLCREIFTVRGRTLWKSGRCKVLPGCFAS